MTTDSSMLHVRMDTEMKQKATAALAAMGVKKRSARFASADEAFGELEEASGQ